MALIGEYETHRSAEDHVTERWCLAAAILDGEVPLPSGLTISQRALLCAMAWGVIESRREGERGGRVVYFIRDPESGLIKIGCSYNERKRLRALQTAHGAELQLLATCPGGRLRESLLHHRFAASRVRGEWFHPTTELFGFISKLWTHDEPRFSPLAEAPTLPSAPKPPVDRDRKPMVPASPQLGWDFNPKEYRYAK